MAFVIGTVLGVILVTVLAARFVVSHRPAMPAAGQALRAAMGFPLLAVVLFALAVVVTLAQPVPPNRPDIDPGAPIFAFVFFLIYALVIGAVVGVPTAFVAVRAFRP